MSALLVTTVIKNFDSPSIPHEQEFLQWSGASYLGDRPSSVNVTIVDENESQDLNLRYRKKSTPTNVLSFPLELPEYISEPCLGDLVICAPVVEREAEQQGKPGIAHWAHMVVHGMLHLQGYDHESDEQATEMETLEIRILQGLGFDNPYELDAETVKSINNRDGNG